LDAKEKKSDQVGKEERKNKALKIRIPFFA
jgi:hypothetical protein